MLEHIDDELRNDQTNADGLTGRGGAPFDMRLQGDRPTVADHRGRQGLTQPR